jgi:AmiR/NasT family two-component response regulator
MIAIIDFENPTILKELLDTNAHGVLVRPIRPGGVLSTLVLALSHRSYEARLLGKVAKLEETLKARREIEKATRIIMKLRSLSEGEAYEFIRRQATAKRISTAAIATSIINAQTILSELDGNGKG